MTGRSVPEWVGSSPDAAIPPRVRLRIWERFGGRCALTGRKLRPGDHYDFDHIIALANGGEHRENNLQLVSREAHREKTRQDVALKSKAARVRAKHLGIAKPKSSLSHPTLRKKMDGSVVPKEARRG
jgi:5-methylcytosine-specific restriction protein A